MKTDNEFRLRMLQEEVDLLKKNYSSLVNNLERILNDLNKVNL